MSTRCHIRLFLLLFSSVLLLQTASADPVAYELDPEHTHIVWEVDRFGFTRTLGSFTSISGTLEYDSEHPGRSRVTARIDLAGLRSDLKQREDIVRGEYWLDAASHPFIEFSSTEVKLNPSVESGGYLVAGTMTLKGKEASLLLNVTLNKAGTDPVTKAPAIGFSANGSFDRSKFGVNTAIGPIGKEVHFRIEALAIGAKKAVKSSNN